MKFTAKLLTLAVASSAAIAPTAFAQSADLSITGKIFPGACTVMIENNGVADFGDIRADTLKPLQETLLTPVTLPMGVFCESEVRYALLGTDNTQESSTFPDRFGLGFTPADEKIGRAVIRIVDPIVDGVSGSGTHSSDGGQTWSPSLYAGFNDIQLSSLLGFAKTTGVSTGPDAIKTLQAGLMVNALIWRSDELTLVEDVPINGSATLNLIYL